MLEQLLDKNKTLVLQRWFENVLETYPAETRKFLGSQRNRFSNPVGASISEGMDGLYQHLLHGTDVESADFSQFLDRIIRIRAVQQFSPSQAIGFIFLLKQVVRETLAREVANRGLEDEFVRFERRIDRLALLSFDKYMECRETIFDIRIREIKDSTCRTWERICRKYGDPEGTSDTESNLPRV